MTDSIPIPSMMRNPTKTAASAMSWAVADEDGDQVSTVSPARPDSPHCCPGVMRIRVDDQILRVLRRTHVDDVLAE